MFSSCKDLDNGLAGRLKGPKRLMPGGMRGGWRSTETHLSTSREIASMNTFAFLCLADSTCRCTASSGAVEGNG